MYQEKLAAEHGVKINYQVQGLSTYTPKQNYYDAVVLIFLNFDNELKRIVHQKVVSSLKQGGRVILEVFEKEQLKNIFGEPKNEKQPFSPEDITEDFINLEFEKFAKLSVELYEGKFHQGKATVIRFVGIKPVQE